MTSSPKCDSDSPSPDSPSKGKFYFVVPDVSLWWIPFPDETPPPPPRVEILDRDQYEARLIIYGPLVNEPRRLGTITALPSEDSNA